MGKVTLINLGNGFMMKPEWGMRCDAKGLANQDNRYAKIAKNGAFAQFVSGSLLELGGLTNPLKYHLKCREALC